MPCRPQVALGMVLAAALALCTRPALAAGPLLVSGAGQPLVWGTLPIHYNPDRGGLGTMDNATAVQFVGNRFATWAAVPTALLSFTNAGALPVDVTASNAGQYIGVCDGLNPIVFDTDGSIVRSLFGIGNENFILGAAGPDCVTYSPPRITEASAILNGRFINGINTQLDPEISLTDFQGVFTHEFGHYLGLDHSQINLIEAFDGNSANDNTVATMFPVLINGQEQSSLNLDDRVAVSMLYPAATFVSGSGSIRGALRRADGTTPTQGAYVIARDTTNPRLNAVGSASGFLFFPNSPGGPPAASLRGYYELDGLTPGKSYTVEIEAVDPQFVGGSSVGPLDPPVTVPVAEFWNGANESATTPPDNPLQATAVSVSAGTPVTGINIIMNSASGSLPPHDLCGQASAIDALPFTDTVDTTGAGESASDPTPSCTQGAATYNSVWYTLTPSDDGMLSVDTCGSDYDTVLSAYTGTCGALTQVACNDDVGSGGSCGAVQSRLDIAVFAGQTYLIEVSQFSAPQGGTLVLNASLGPRDCTNGSCLPGRGSAATECFAEWLVEPVPTFSGRPPTSLRCHDGDGCDSDGDATNHGCTFHVSVCLNNHDPSVGACTPSTASAVEVLSPNRNGTRNRPEDTGNGDAVLHAVTTSGNSSSILGFCTNKIAGQSCQTNAECNSPGRTDGRCYLFVRFQPATAATDSCGVPAQVVVPLRARSNGTYSAASKRLTLRTTNGAGAVDRDTLILRCLPP